MYIIYSAIILVLGIVMFMGGDSVPSREISWNKLEEILLKHDYSKIKIVNREFAEIYISKEALQNDTTYNNLKAKNLFGKETDVQEAFYVYKFVTFESFEKDLENVENQIIATDTTGKGLSLSQKQQIINKVVSITHKSFMLLLFDNYLEITIYTITSTSASLTF